MWIGLGRGRVRFKAKVRVKVGVKIRVIVKNILGLYFRFGLEVGIWLILEIYLSA